MTTPSSPTFKYALGLGDIVPTALLILLPPLCILVWHPGAEFVAAGLILMMAGVFLLTSLYANSRLRVEVGPLGVSIYRYRYRWISHLGWSRIAGIEYVGVQRRAGAKRRQAIALVGPDNTAYLLCTVTSDGRATLKPADDQSSISLEAALLQHGYLIADASPGRTIRQFLRAGLKPPFMTCSTSRPATPLDS